MTARNLSALYVASIARPTVNILYAEGHSTLRGNFDSPANATGSSMTYFANNKQFIVVAIGSSNLTAELVAFSLS